MKRDIKVFCNFKRGGAGAWGNTGQIGKCSKGCFPFTLSPHCNEIQNVHLRLWGKAPFSNAQTKGKAQLNGRGNAFCMPALSWPQFRSCWKKFPDADDSWAPRLEFRWSEKENYTLSLGSGGTRAARETHKGPSMGLPPVHLHPTSWGVHLERRQWGWDMRRDRPVSAHTPGFPPVAVPSLGCQSPLPLVCLLYTSDAADERK